MNSLLVVVKSHLFPQFALAEVTGGKGEFAVVNRGWAGTVPSLASQPYISAYAHARAHTRKNTAGSRDYTVYTRAGRRQSIAMGGQSIGSEVAAAVTHNSDRDSQ